MAGLGVACLGQSSDWRTNPADGHGSESACIRCAGCVECLGGSSFPTPRPGFATVGTAALAAAIQEKESQQLVVFACPVGSSCRDWVRSSSCAFRCPLIRVQAEGHPQRPFDAAAHVHSQHGTDPWSAAMGTADASRGPAFLRKPQTVLAAGFGPKPTWQVHERDVLRTIDQGSLGIYPRSMERALGGQGHRA